MAAVHAFKGTDSRDASTNTSMLPNMQQQQWHNTADAPMETL
jgi:hypothetical protein